MSQREILTPFHLAQESGYGQILQNTLALIYVRDRHGRFIFANQRFLEAFALPLNCVLGKTCAELFPPTIARQYADNDHRVLAHRQVMEFEETAQVQDATRTYISIKFPLFDSSGEVFALCGISTDISERKQRENLLYDVAVKLCSIPDESLFDDVVQYLGEKLGVDFVMVGQLQPDSQRIVTIAACVNGELVPTFDYPLEGTPCAQVIGREFYCVQENLLQLYPGDTMLSHGGYDSYAGYPLYDAQGTALGLLAVTHRQPLYDISFIESILKIFSLRVAAALERQRVEQEKLAAERERKQLARQLQQAQKMEAIGQLAGGIAHDFNNLLTGVMGYISLAREQNPGQGGDKRDQYLDRALAAGRKASELIRQMLTFSRGEAGQRRPVLVQQLVPAFVGLMEASLPYSIDVVVDNDPHLPAVLLDPLHLEQVLMNLCINARDAMAGSGRLTLSTHRVIGRTVVCESCQQSVRGDFVAVSVADTGSGIAPSTLERMFEPFFSTKAVGKGSGMGLAMVHGMVHEYGGHVQVESCVGQGSVFTVLLPVHQPPVSAAVAAPAQHPQASRRLAGQVIVVDDQPVVSEFMQDLLGNWGLDVVVFHQPQDALTYVQQSPADLRAAIVDYAMPQMSGLQWAEQVATLRPDLPVLLYSGYRENIDLDAAARIGIREVLRKPIDELQLFQWLRNLPETNPVASK